MKLCFKSGDIAVVDVDLVGSVNNRECTKVMFILSVPKLNIL